MPEVENKNPVVRKVKRISKKSGNPYVSLEITYKGYTKGYIMLENAEMFIFDDLPLVDLTQSF